MDKLLQFFIKVNSLNEIERTGWTLLKVKNAETIGEHMFRVAIASWIFALKKGLNVKRAIKIAISHDLCEVYSGDLTPYYYYTNLPRNKKNKEESLKKWVRLSLKEKQKRGKIKFNIEKRGILKLIKHLDPEIKKDIFLTWIGYEKGSSPEGKMVKQIDRIEVLLQSIEYFGADSKKAGTSWWEGTEEIVEDKLLIDFLHVIQNKFYGKKRKIKKNKDLDNALSFLLKTGDLKKMARKGWVIRGVKKPLTVGAHIFLVFIMCWVLSKKNKIKLNEEKLFKMILSCNLSKIYAGDVTPYDMVLKGKSSQEKTEILKRWLRSPKNEKAKMFLLQYKTEKESIEKLLHNFPITFKKEIIELWDESKNLTSPEAYFLNQVEAMATLLQAVLYHKEDPSFPIEGIWEWAFEVIDSPFAFEFVEELQKKFTGKKLTIKQFFHKMSLFDFLYKKQ